MIELYNDTVIVSRYYAVHGTHRFFLGNMAPIDPKPSNRTNLEFNFDPMFIESIRKESRTVTHIGVKKFDSGECHAIEFKTKGQTWTVYLNVNTFLLDYISGSYPDGSVALTKIDDYQLFDNFLIAKSRVTMKEGNIFSWESIKEIKLNVPIDPTVFEYKQRK